MDGVSTSRCEPDNFTSRGEARAPYLLIESQKGRFALIWRRTSIPVARVMKTILDRTIIGSARLSECTMALFQSIDNLWREKPPVSCTATHCIWETRLSVSNYCRLLRPRKRVTPTRRIFSGFPAKWPAWNQVLVNRSLYLLFECWKLKFTLKILEIMPRSMLDSKNSTKGRRTLKVLRKRVRSLVRIRELPPTWKKSVSTVIVTPLAISLERTVSKCLLKRTSSQQE